MKRFFTAVLVVMGFLGALITAGVVVNGFTDFRILPSQTTAMSPTVRWGALVIAKKIPESEAVVGLPVIIDNGSGQSVMGRVISSTQYNDQGYYSIAIQGDNRSLPETFPYKVKNNTYEIATTIPVAGIPFLLFTTFVGNLILGIAITFIALILVLQERKKLPKKPTAEEPPSGSYESNGIEQLEALFNEQEAYSK